MYNLAISPDLEASMSTVIQGSASDREKKWIRDRIRRSLNPATFDPNPGTALPGVIAGPETGNPFRDFQRRAGRRVCDRWASGGRPGIVPYRDSYYRELCDPYLGDDAPNAPTTEPPFDGGQCPGINYLFRYRGTIPDPPTDTGVTQTTRRGPLSLDTSLLPGDTCGGLEGTFRRWRLTGQNGTINVWSGCNATLGIIEVLPLSTEPPGGCGSLPPVFTPGEPTTPPTPSPGPVGGPTGYPFPDFDIDISPEGEIIIDFGDGSPPESFDPTEGDEGGGPDVAPTEPGSPGDSGESGDGGSSEGCAPDGQELTGVLVTVLSAHENANTLDRSPETVYRGVGFVAMGYPGLLGVDTSAAVVESPQFFHAQQRGLTCWRVRANVGFNLETTPYYREIEQ